jgi:hypothetical protein
MKYIFIGIIFLFLLSSCFRVPDYVINVKLYNDGVSWKTNEEIIMWEVELWTLASKRVFREETNKLCVSWRVPRGNYILYINGYDEDIGTYRYYYKNIIRIY